MIPETATSTPTGLPAEAASVSLQANKETSQFVTMRVADQLFGISVYTVQDVLRYQKITRIPLAPPEIAGSLNLRGRIVTAIDVRQRLGLGNAVGNTVKPMSVVVDHKGELYSLLVDSVGEVLSLPLARCEKNPANLAPRWKEVSNGIFRLKNELLVILDVQALLTF
jgi:purine-binding chemotaxis protein CheW